MNHFLNRECPRTPRTLAQLSMDATCPSVGHLSRAGSSFRYRPLQRGESMAVECSLRADR